MIDVPFDTQGVLARTLWAEARSQGGEGMHAVANVILNRAAQPGWWGRDIRSVCLAPKQFSCWNENDPQAKVIRAESISDRSYEIASTIADMAIGGVLPDITGGADHYVAEYALDATHWDDRHTATFVCGKPRTRHYFFRLGLAG